jgi:phytoene synthase
MIAEAIRPDDQGVESASSRCSTDSADGRLAMVHDRLDELYAGTVELPLPEFREPTQHVLHAIGVVVRRYGIPREYFLDLATGCLADVRVARYATWASLEKYCRQTGGAVARVVAGVLGMTHSDAGRQAEQLGIAVRLTAILRDLTADLARGRIYLPLEDLARFRYSERDLAGGVVNDRFRDLMGFEIERARSLYRGGAEAIGWVAGDGSRLAAATVTVLAAGVLSSIERHGYNVFSATAGLTTSQKFRRLPAAWRLARREPGRPIPKIV